MTNTKELFLFSLDTMKRLMLSPHHLMRLWPELETIIPACRCVAPCSFLILERDGFGGAGVGPKRVREQLFAAPALALPQVPVGERGLSSCIADQREAVMLSAIRQSPDGFFCRGAPARCDAALLRSQSIPVIPTRFLLPSAGRRKSSRSDDLTQRYIRRTLHMRQLTALFLDIRLRPDDTQICDSKGHFEYSYCNLELL